MPFLKQASRNAMNEYEKFVPDELRAMVSIIVDKARANLEKDGFLAPAAFIGRMNAAAVDVDVMGGLGRVSKDAAALLVRKMAAKKDADFVLWVDECWVKSIPASSMQDAMRVRDEVGGEVRNMPGRIDAVMFSLQTHSGVFIGHAVREGVEGNYTFGAVDFRISPHVEGRFMTLLPPRGSKQ